MSDDSFAMGYALGNDASSSRNNNNDSGFGGANSWIWIIVVFALLFGWGNNGNRGGGSGGGTSGSGGGDSMAAFLPYIAGSVTGGGALTRGELCQDMNFADVQAGVRNINDSVNLGFANLNSALCQTAYENAGLVNGLSNTIQSGFNAMNISNLQTANAQNIAQLQSTNALQTQLADCCCTTQRAIDGVNYNMSQNTCAITNTMNTNTRDIIDSQNAGTRAILDYLCQEKISDLQSENQALRLSASQTAQNQYLISQLRPFPVASYQVPNPFTGAYGFQGYGYNGCCGC